MWDAMGASCVSKPSRPFHIMFYWSHTQRHTYARACFLTSLSLDLLTHPTGMVFSGVCEAAANHYIVQKSILQKPSPLSTREGPVITRLRRMWVGRQQRQQGAVLHMEKRPCTLTMQLTNESKLILGLGRTEHSHTRDKARPLELLGLDWEKEAGSRREEEEGPSEGDFWC